MFRIRLLIANDWERSLMAEALAEHGYAVNATSFDLEESGTLDSSRIDAVVIDSGGNADAAIDAVRGVRANPKSADLPVIVCGPADQVPELIIACALGATDFAIRPGPMNRFIERLDRAVSVAMADPESWVGKALVGVAA